MASNFEFLCRSLGVDIYRHVHTRENDSESYSDSPIFRFSELAGNTYGPKIKSIKKTGIFTEMQCIKVSNYDSLYITDDFVTTHNTTTSTVLANAFVKAVNAFCKANPKQSPQRVIRTIEKTFKTILEPAIIQWSQKVNLETGKEQLRAVAKTSANGDSPLADAVIECFDLVGDEGNVTILEFAGPSRYEVERLEGYGVPTGLEDCCGPFYQKFINDNNTQSCLLDSPIFILYYGQIREVSICANLFEKIVEGAGGKVPNVVLVTTGFSETVLAHLAVNFSAANKNINVYPLVVPLSPIKTGQHDFLSDLSAMTGAKIFDMIQRPLESGSLEDIGVAQKFEASRFRSNVLIEMDRDTEERIFNRVDELNKQLGSVATSELDKQLLRERIGKLTGGIAKLKIFGSSTGEVREKRDRAEDAICAVRGAIKHGTLCAGGYTLYHLSDIMAGHADVVSREVIAKALIEPVDRLFHNAGFTKEEQDEIVSKYKDNQIFDLIEGKMVDAYQHGLLDSTPAVLEAVRNSISIATRLGACGGTVAFQRDIAVERQEAKEIREYLRTVEEEPITERP
jgi:chaperonin GroEL